MKCTDFAAFKKKFFSSSQVVLLIASEERESLKKVLDLYGSKCITFDADTFTPAKFCEEVETLPFFEEQRLVVVRGVDALTTAHQTLLCNTLLRPHPRVRLLLSASTLSASHPLLKAVEEHGLVLQLPSLKPWEVEKELQASLIKKAHDEGYILQATEAKRLASISGRDAEQELNKLICYCGERKQITASDLDVLCCGRGEVTIWQLGEAIFRFDFQTSVMIGRRLLEETALLSLLAGIRSQIMTAMEVISLHDQGGAPLVAKTFPYLKGGLLEKKISASKSYGIHKLKSSFLDLVASEVEAKNSATSPELLLEILLCKLCHSTSSRTF